MDLPKELKLACLYADTRWNFSQDTNSQPDPNSTGTVFTGVTSSDETMWYCHGGLYIKPLSWNSAICIWIEHDGSWQLKVKTLKLLIKKACSWQKVIWLCFPIFLQSVNATVVSKDHFFKGQHSIPHVCVHNKSVWWNKMSVLFTWPRVAFHNHQADFKLQYNVRSSFLRALFWETELLN